MEIPDVTTMTIGEDGSGRTHLPDVVECLLYIANQHDYGPEHEQQADTQEHTALGMNEIRIDKTDNDVCHLRL